MSQRAKAGTFLTSFSFVNSKVQKRGRFQHLSVMLKFGFGQFSEPAVRVRLFPLSVRGSEGLFMVNGPPSFTESAVFQRYCAVTASGLGTPEVIGCGEVEGAPEVITSHSWTDLWLSDFFLKSKCRLQS